jgi:uncharacterized protein with HEPN domain
LLTLTGTASAQSLGSDERTVSAIERQLFILGEAAKQLPEALRRANPHVEWRAIKGFRDVLAHTYWKIDPEVLWNTVVADVPVLEAQLRVLAGEDS